MAMACLNSAHMYRPTPIFAKNQMIFAKIDMDSQTMPSRLFRFLSLATFAMLCHQLVAWGQTDANRLQVSASVGQFQHVDTKIQYYGMILLDGDPESGESETVPIDVRARFTYDQQLSAVAPSPQATRYYQTANATIKRGEETLQSDLSGTSSYVVHRIKTDRTNAQKYQAAGIGFVLTQSQYELLRNPGDSLALLGLLERTNPKVGDEWTLDDDALARLTAVDRIIEHNVQAKIKSIDRNRAIVYLSGHATADLEDVESELDVMASVTIDIQEQSCVSLRMNLNQTTPAGQLQPGFDGQIKLDVTLQTIESSDNLTRERLAAVMRGNKIRQSLLLAPESATFQIEYSPEWKLIAADSEAAVLRLRRDGRLIAQCNAVRLPDRDPKQPLALETFQNEIKQKIAKSELVQVIDATEFKTTEGYAALRVTVDGIEDGLKIRWQYYHLADESGRAMTLVFSHDQELASEFGDADRTLVNHVRLVEPRTAEIPAGPNR